MALLLVGQLYLTLRPRMRQRFRKVGVLTLLYVTRIVRKNVLWRVDHLNRSDLVHADIRTRKEMKLVDNHRLLERVIVVVEHDTVVASWHLDTSLSLCAGEGGR